jgi:glutaredoxin 3
MMPGADPLQCRAAAPYIQADTQAKPECIMPPVVIYTRQFCGFCSAAKRLLESKGVAFEERDATFSKELRAEMIQKANGLATFPQIFIGDVHVGGSDDLHALEHDGKLDPMLKAG